MKYLWLFVLLLLSITLAMPVHAFDYNISTSNIIVSRGDLQAVELKISTPIDDTIIFSIDGIQPWVSSPISLQLPKNYLSTTRIYFSPDNNAEIKDYPMTISLQSLSTGSISKKNITISIKGTNLAVENIVVNGDLKPESTNDLEILVKNYENKIEGANLIVKILKPDNTEFDSFEKELSLDVKEFANIKKSIILPECAISGSYKIKISLYDKNRNMISSKQSEFVVKNFFETKTEREETKNGLKNEVTLTTKNIGNIAGMATVTDKVWGTLFMIGDQPNTIEQSGIDGIAKWQFDLDACQVKIVKYSIDYTYVAAGVVIFFLLLYIFIRLRTVTIKKSVLKKEMIKKDEEYTIGIDVKSYIGIKDIEIKDFVPAIFTVVDTPGIKPIKHKTSAGTELIWKFREFKSGEERVFDYKIVPSFSVTGTVSLPKATVVFNCFGKRFRKQSPVAHIGMTEKIEKDDESIKTKIKNIFFKN